MTLAGRPRGEQAKVGLADKQGEATHSPLAPTPHRWAVKRIEDTGRSPIASRATPRWPYEEIEEVPTLVTITGACTRRNRRRPHAFYDHARALARGGVHQIADGASYSLVAPLKAVPWAATSHYSDHAPPASAFYPSDNCSNIGCPSHNPGIA